MKRSVKLPVKNPVSRSIYQKVVEENKRLKKDIKVMACGHMVDAIQMRIKWRKHFEDENRFNNIIKKMIRGMRK